MYKRILMMVILLATIVSLSLSISTLTRLVGEENIEKINNIITQEMKVIKDSLDEQIGIKEIARVERTTQGMEIIPIGTASINGNMLEVNGMSSRAEETKYEVATEATETTEIIEVETTEIDIPETVVTNEDETIEERLRIVLVEILDDGTKVYKFKGGTFTVPNINVNQEPRTTDTGYVEKIYNVPQYFQQSYPKTNYGNHGTISSHGCGITSVAMVFSYLLDREIMPDELAAKYGRFNTEHGSAYALFETSADDYGIEVTRVYSWKEVNKALENGCVVISNVRNNLFTEGGHYIVYHGITEDGKVLVRDPNIYNFGRWSAKALKEGFANGFEDKYVKYSFPCWIYAPKDLDAIATAASQADAD